MFTEADLEALVPAQIFARGLAYYCEHDAVGKIHQQGNVFKAKVRGTKTYHVKLTIHPKGQPSLSCDCPYYYGDVCKHSIALGLAVLDVLADDEQQPPREPLPTLPIPKLSEKEQQKYVLRGAWKRTSDKDKTAFLKQLLANQPKLLRQFLEAFEFSEKALLAAEAPAKYQLTAPDSPRIRVLTPAPRPRPAKPLRPAARVAPAAPAVAPAAPRRVLTLSEQADKLLAAGKGRELLPLLLTVDWLREPPAWDTKLLPYLLAQAARYQPEATMDAVMERFEGYLEKLSARSPMLYERVAECLKSLAVVPTLASQVNLFASELLQQYSRLHALRKSLGYAGFAVIVSELDTSLPPKRPGRKPMTK